MKLRYRSLIAIVSSLGTIGTASLAQAEVAYKISATEGSDRVTITMKIPVKGIGTQLEMPNWAPGHYVFEQYGRRVTDFSAFDASGKPVEFVHSGENAWRVPGINGGEITVKYQVPSATVDGVMSLSGPQIYMYVVGRLQEPCKVTLDIPAGWDSAIGIVGHGKEFRAKNYDIFADNPISLGKFVRDEYVAFGKKHVIALRGAAKSKVDRPHLVKACKFVSEMAGDFFGGVPYDTYTWHFTTFDAPDGAGGLEHLSSTQIQLASGVGVGSVGVLAHEFFHLWNVKRIRSKVLGPFDYTQLPQTGALWWLEGVDDYFAHNLLRRYGWTDNTQYFKEVVGNIRSQTRNAAHKEVSAYEASYRVRDAAGGRGNSQGYKISYYDTGHILGLCLDIELLSKTNGKHSLDDVEKALFKMCKDDQPGFEEGEIRNQLVRFGGASLGEFYDTYVMKPGELPYEAQLAKVGLEVTSKPTKVMELGFRGTPDLDAKGVVLTSEYKPVGAEVLPKGTILLSLNDHVFEKDSEREMRQALRNVTEKLTAESKLSLRVKLPGSNDIKTLTVSPVATETTSLRIEPVSNASAEAVHLRDLWLSKKR